MTNRDCKHGQQARACQICDLEGERDALRTQLEAIRAAGGEVNPSKILVTALRQYMHNDGSGLLAGYDYDETQRIVAAMAAELEKARKGFPAMVEYVEEIAQLRAELEAARKQEPAGHVPSDCRQRLAAEGKPYPRSNCKVCGPVSPKWRECAALLAGQQAEVKHDA